MIKIDGSYGEGGGQIVRNALALSTVTGKAFEVNNIRKGRKKPGLKTQHLYCIKALKELCDGITKGDDPGSLFLSYSPGEIEGKDLALSMDTAGSISLLLQSLLLPSLFSRKKMRIFIKGGTDVRWSMPFDYFNQVFLPYVNFFGKVEATLLKRGYFPRGGGEVTVSIEPLGMNSIEEFKKNISPLEITSRGELIELNGTVHLTPELEKRDIGKRILKSAQRFLKGEGFNSHIKIQKTHSSSDGCGLVLWGKFKSGGKYPVIIGADKLGERGVTSEQVGKEGAGKLIKRIQCGAPVEEHLADNLLPFMAIVGGEIKIEKITGHILSGIYVIEKFLGKVFEVDEERNIIKTLG